MVHPRSVLTLEPPALRVRARRALRNRSLRTALEAAMWLALLVAFFYIIWHPPQA